jgi:hypothetical protein
MGMYATGTICFGLLLDEDDTEMLPWEAESFDNGEQDWWQRVNGYMSPFEIYNEDGRLPGVTEEQVSEYWNHLFTWKKENPLPFHLVNYCHCDYPMYILAIRSTVKEGDAGEPRHLGRDDLLLNTEERDVLLTFFDTYGIVVDENKLGWWLSGCYH